MATRYFYAINRDNIQQIDDTYSAYALDRVESINNYFAGVAYRRCDCYTPLILDDVTLCSDAGRRNQRDAYWLVYIIPKYNDELIYVHNPDPDNPVYMLRGVSNTSLTYAYGCLQEMTADGNGNATSWRVRGYQVKDMIVDINVPSKATADIIYIFGGHLTFYDNQPKKDDITKAVAARKAIANKLKILRYRPIKYVTEGFAHKGHNVDIDPSRLYPIKLTQHQWSISQLSGCGAEIPNAATWDHPDSVWHINVYDKYETTHIGGTRYYYYRDMIDGGYGMLSSGYAEVMAMDCTRYL